MCRVPDRHSVQQVPQLLRPNSAANELLPWAGEGIQRLEALKAIHEVKGLHDGPLPGSSQTTPGNAGALVRGSSDMTEVLLVVGVLAAATALGLVWRHRSGRGRVQSAGRPSLDVDLLADLGVTGDGVTLLQFSTAFCQPCRATRRVLADVAARVPGVHHIDVDAESHLQAVRALGIARTPTTLVVDAEGRLRNRVVGQPRTADVLTALAPLLEIPIPTGESDRSPG